MNLTKFQHIEFAYAYFLLILFIGIFVWRLIKTKRSLTKFGDEKLVSQLIKYRPKYNHIIKFGLLLLAFCFMIFSLMNLQFGSKIENVKKEGIDIVLAIDLSNSMMAEDIQPNRLERTKQFISRFLDKLANDRIGVIVFAGNAYVQMPLTVDYSAAKLFLSNLNTNMLPTQGTAIGEAITLSKEMFESASKKHKTLVILSDGENHEGNAIEIAKEASEDGIIIHTVGVGTLKGAPIPIYRGQQVVDFQKDNNGSIILSKINESMLQEIAAVGNGKYFRVANSGDNLKELLNILGSQEKKEIETRSVTEYESKFQYFLAIALLLLLIEFIISERKTKTLLNFN